MKITRAKPTPSQTPTGNLAIKNWDKYQSLSKTGKPLPWLRDFADQAIDLDYSRLSLFERGLLQECRRLCTRTGGRPIHGDFTYIARACNIKDTDRARLGHALDTLIQRGFLIPVESANVISRAETDTEQKQKQKQKQSRAEADPGSDSSLTQAKGSGKEPAGFHKDESGDWVQD